MASTYTPFTDLEPILREGFIVLHGRVKAYFDCNKNLVRLLALRAICQAEVAAFGKSTMVSKYLPGVTQLGLQENCARFLEKFQSEQIQSGWPTDYTIVCAASDYLTKFFSGWSAGDRRAYTQDGMVALFLACKEFGLFQNRPVKPLIPDEIQALLDSISASFGEDEQFTPKKATPGAAPSFDDDDDDDEDQPVYKAAPRRRKAGTSLEHKAVTEIVYSPKKVKEATSVSKPKTIVSSPPLTDHVTEVSYLLRNMYPDKYGDLAPERMRQIVETVSREDLVGISRAAQQKKTGKFYGTPVAKPAASPVAKPAAPSLFTVRPLGYRMGMGAGTQADDDYQG